MTPVLYQGRIVGWLPAVLYQQGRPYATYAIMPDFVPYGRPHHVNSTLTAETIDLRIVNQRSNGAPGELHADSLYGLLRLSCFSPEDTALPMLEAAS